ncbi:SusC/RagA family TonB-linked outer membrane protein [Saccharicrinis aurantiacus]|uniref:SusC/RagA family TonB-linked outer membrane protein n=1 Tax=Saccharicrinis aurantiacus TaxID=1849719 RepID=UPI0024913B67|nr:SusC/RagA family TonB-linked outer membrane protein [Saccharicrinis aurantiacus]
MLSVKGKDKLLTEVFKEIRNTSEFTFVYDHSDVVGIVIDEVSFDEVSVEDILDNCLVNTGLVYEVIDNVIVLKRLAVNTSLNQQSKKRTITGIVKDDKTGELMPGVAVVEKGTSNGTVTSFDGDYSIEVSTEDAILQFSFIGMDIQEIPATSAIINCDLKEESVMIEELVVVGMHKVDRRFFTGATDKVSASSARLDGTPDASRMLEGRSAGVSVQNQSGTFGAAPKIRVRGASSIYGNQKPLWVVDGVILEDVVNVGADELSSGDPATLISSAIAGLNANDIESFQILKDGSATSIYGARAMNGVIVITTKRGSAGITTINYSGEFTTRLTPTYSQFNIMNSQDQMEVYRELEAKGWLDHASISRAQSGGVYNKMYNQINTYDPNTGKFKVENTPEGRMGFLKKYEMANTNWFNELFSATPMQTHSVSISSGTEKARTYASLSYFGDPGWTPASDVQRFTGNMNVAYDLNEKLTLSFLTTNSYRKQTAPGTLSQSVDVVAGQVSRDFDINPFSYALNTSRAMTLYNAESGEREFFRRNYTDFNILHELENNYMEYNVADLKFQGEIDYKINPKLQAKALGSFRYSTTKREHKINEKSNQANAYRANDDQFVSSSNKYLYRDPDDPNGVPIVVLPVGGIYDFEEYSMSAFDVRATLNYNNTLAGIHSVNLFGGGEVRASDRSNSWFRGWGYQFDQGGIPFLDPNLFKQQIEGNNDYYRKTNNYDRSTAFFATSTYAYRGKYSLNLTGRYEGSNQMGKSRSSRWLPTWNVATAWNVHEERFFKHLRPLMSHLTTRLSYSLTAERGPASNAAAYFLNQTTFRPIVTDKESSITLVDLENSELTWEKKHEFNVGLDAGFLKNRINLSGDYYIRNNFDLIGLIRTSGVGGQVNKLANYANMESSGYEMSLTTTNIKKDNFSWVTNFTYSYAQNKITKLENTPRIIDLVSGTGTAVEGYPVRAIFSIPFAGLNEDGLPTFRTHDGGTTVTDHNFQETSAIDHLIYEGPVDPTTTGGLGNTFSYKNFKLNVFATYSFGNVIRLDPYFSSSYSDLDASPKEFKNRWMVAGDERVTNIPVIPSSRQVAEIPNLNMAYNAYNYSDARIADGSFIRMKEISLTYDISKETIEKLGIGSASLRLQALNPFLIYADSKLQGQDPEFVRSGGVAMPIPKQFTLTLRVGL